MPAVNDLTPEEEAEFAQHGVTSAGPGGEPIAEGQEEEGQQQAGEEGGEQGGEPAQVSRHRPDGTFKSKEEYEAEVAAAQGQQGGDDGQQGGEPKMVPHQALHEARQKAAENARLAQIATARLNAVIMAQQHGQPQNEQLPDLEQDPAGYIRAMNERLERFEQARAQETEFRQIDNALEQDELAFAASVPDYDEASDFYVQSRARELAQFYPPQQIQQMLMQEARTIAQQAWQRGMSAAAFVYQSAQARGYTPGNTAADPLKNPLPARSNGGGPTPRAAVAAARAGQGVKSLSGGAAAGTAQLNAEALLAMSDEEFEAHLQLGRKGADQRFAQIG